MPSTQVRCSLPPKVDSSKLSANEVHAPRTGQGRYVDSVLHRLVLVGIGVVESDLLALEEEGDAHSSRRLNSFERSGEIFLSNAVVRGRYAKTFLAEGWPIGGRHLPGASIWSFIPV